MSEFRILFQPCIGSGKSEFRSDTFGSYELANMIMQNIALYTLYLHDADLMDDYSNYGIIQQKVNGEWVDFN